MSSILSTGTDLADTHLDRQLSDRLHLLLLITISSPNRSNAPVADIPSTCLASDKFVRHVTLIRPWLGSIQVIHGWKWEPWGSSLVTVAVDNL